MTSIMRWDRPKILQFFICMKSGMVNRIDLGMRIETFIIGQMPIDTGTVLLYVDSGDGFHGGNTDGLN